MVDVAQLVEPRIVIPAVAGSSPVVHPTFTSRASFCLVFVWFIGPLAQLVEQLTLNQLVVGSIPTRPTISLKNNKFLDIAPKKLKSFPHRSEFPPFDSEYLFD
jgi:hypothetical protein